MASAGILMHTRHLDTVGWERLVWGDPDNDSLGSLPKVVDLLLNEAASEPISHVIFGCGPSERNGLSEGEYSKRYLLGHLTELGHFPSLRDRLAGYDPEMLRKRLQDVIIMLRHERTMDEVHQAADMFRGYGVSKVYEVTSASHAPRCVQLQAEAKLNRLIPTGQQWFVVADDRSYEGNTPVSTLVLEPPHRGDDPMLAFQPQLADVLRPYFYDLDPKDKKELVRVVSSFMKSVHKPSE